MNLHTASEGISLARQLEHESAKFYEDLARRYTESADSFLSFANENKKSADQIQRTYYGVITDAIEGCYCFDINPEEYTFETELANEASYSDALNKAIGIEEKIIKFYSDAAEQSKPLMADIPRAFAMLAKKRSRRILQLKSLLGMTNPDKSR